MISNNSSLTEFQKLNQEIYLMINDRAYDNAGIFFRLFRHITQILKAVRKKDYKNMDYYICMSFSWSLALANRFHISLADETWKRFPGFCPYCLSAPCACPKKRLKKRQKLKKKSLGKRPKSLSEWQQMFARIYPNVVQTSVTHLAEEAGEVAEAIGNYSATRGEDWLVKITEELIDLITNIFAVATCLDFNLANGLVNYFANGCPKCHSSPCSCGYVVVDHPVPFCGKFN